MKKEEKIMNYRECKKRVSNLGFNFSLYAYNQVRFHNKNETPKHYFCKAIFAKVLKDKNLSFFTEYDFPNNACCDVWIVDYHKVVEFETELDPIKAFKKKEQYKKYGLDLVIIYCKDVPDDPNFAYTFFLSNQRLSIL